MSRHYLLPTRIPQTNFVRSHAHIYGIDLASQSELIASHKSADEVASTIGADEVIYQSLDDLQAACAELSPRDPKTQRFEVGVFCGKYVTPVDDGYFEHLEQIRGERKLMKVQESARQAIVNGSAREEDVRIVAHGAEVDRFGRVHPSGSDAILERSGVRRSGAASPSPQRSSMDSGERKSVRNTQDISLDNLNDHEQ